MFLIVVSMSYLLQDYKQSSVGVCRGVIGYQGVYVYVLVTGQKIYKHIFTNNALRTLYTNRKVIHYYGRGLLCH